MGDPARPRFLDRLSRIYGPDQAPGIAASVEGLVTAWSGRIPRKPSGWSQRDAFLITYADSILGTGPPLQVLDEFLRDQVGDLITFVHLLPFCPFTSDDGFSVTDYRQIRENLGSWDDLAHLAERYRLVFDWVLNHSSASSTYMQAFCAGRPEYADFFCSLAPDTDTSSVLRTRNLPLLHDYPTHEGVQWLWTTFSRDQVDLNYANPRVLLEMLDVMLFYTERGASMLRLDAVPYLWKELGTSCAHLPQTHELIKLFRDVLDAVAPHVLLLTETNVPHRENVTYFGDRGDEAQVIYNFALAPLILWSLYKGDASVLSEWARGIRYVGANATYLNITATHDGIGVRPTEGILSQEERMELVRLAHDHGGDVTGKKNADGSVSPYELNLSYFDAVNDPRAEEPEELQVARFVLSQAIPMAMMGLPGIYIHSLVGSRNDLEGVRRTGRARSINREQLHADALVREIHPAGGTAESIRARVFGEMMRLLALRREQPAFHPDASQEIPSAGPGCFAVRRAGGSQAILALHNVTNRSLQCDAAGMGLTSSTRDLLSAETTGSTVHMRPYQVRWLERG